MPGFSPLGAALRQVRAKDMIFDVGWKAATRCWSSQFVQMQIIRGWLQLTDIPSAI